LNPLQEFLQTHATGDLLPWPAQLAATVQFRLSFAVVEDAALALGLMPSRYQRNRQTISVEQQLRLFRSRVAVLGLGGLGGNVVEGLARLGVGTIVAIDPDVFQEHNLNRQILSSVATLGRGKADAAAARVCEINPAVTVVPLRTAYTPANGRDLLRASDAVVDGLDSIPTRLALAHTCSELGIPMVHGAIAGWYGQVITQFPGDGSIERLYRRWRDGAGAEQHLGNPSFTPALVASIETAEVCKILLNTGTALRSRKLSINLLDMTFEEIVFEQSATEPARPQPAGDDAISSAMRISALRKTAGTE
jgi:molybdopterin/thiamine biosynthesis adenylyltransferase